MVHNRDRGENLENSLIERTPKTAFRALDLLLKPFRPYLCVLKTDQQVSKAKELVSGVFKIFQNRLVSPSSSSS